MEKTPLSMRKYVAIFGPTNAGKSTLFNAMLGQDVSIVSEIEGTTTDPVIKAMELIPYGPIALVDTAGLGDTGVLGERREKKTIDILSRCDIILFVRDVRFADMGDFDFGKVPVINVYTKCDVADEEKLQLVRENDKKGVFIFDHTFEGLAKLREEMVSALKKLDTQDETLLGDIVPSGGMVVLVIPIDSAAPKGRLILPQVQTIRDCLDHDIRAVSTTVKMLEDTLKSLKKTDLVVTDSQAFHEVARIVPDEIPLTSFSMLLANQKGRISQLIKGTDVIPNLLDGDKVLMLEACTHSTTHDDIGRVKIPSLLQKKTGKKLEFVHFSGYDLPENLEEYKLIIQCGGCMINKKAIQNRLELFKEKGIPVTNYGVVLAYLTGILTRAKKVFENKG
ncbi:MAG: [FeFe] hydrogenase H-cluster maturation GTPase HydF [Clostridia bacterium]|nr:[FeFe] hydrogenase H-cluster maturation GTPase HydF [Clostridia bacterium]